MKPEMNYTLYLCTDRRLMTTDTLEEAVELAIQGGVTVVQLREKDCTSREFYEEAGKVKAITDAYEIPLLINDRLDIALAVGADGVHLGQNDIRFGLPETFWERIKLSELRQTHWKKRKRRGNPVQTISAWETSLEHRQRQVRAV